MAELDKDLLKKTAGLLAEIDRVAAAPSVAERVARVIESAAPDRRYDTFDSFEAWDWQRSGYSYRVENAERLHAERHMPQKCACPVVEAVIWGEDGEDGPREVKALDCETDSAPRDDPIFWDKPPYYHDTHGLSTHAASKPCGAKGCACEGLWDLPETAFYEAAKKRYGMNPALTAFYEAWVPDPGEVAAIRDYGERIHAQVEARFMALNIPTSLLDTDIVD